jgi:hypothetical protein
MPEPIPEPDFRPDGYWDVADPVVAVTASIRGELRRRLVTDLLTGEAERHGVGPWALDGFDLDADLLADETAEGALERRCQMHPWFRGGEHLPALLSGEVARRRVGRRLRPRDPGTDGAGLARRPAGAAGDLRARTPRGTVSVR